MNLFHYCIWKDHYSAVKKLAEHNYGIKLHQVNYLAKINVASKYNHLDRISCSVTHYVIS